MSIGAYSQEADYAFGSNPPYASGSALLRDAALTANCAVQSIDQYLNLDELVAGPFGLVAVKRSSQHLRMHVPVLDHARTGFIQRFKSLAHFGLLSWEGWAPRRQREFHAYTDPTAGAIDQWRGVSDCRINPACEPPHSGGNRDSRAGITCN